jgi:hypothetical protein
MSNRQREIYHSENGDTTMDAPLSCTKPTYLPAERRPKSNSETFSEEAKRAPSIKRLPA